jgi:tetraacyldisaccharide 4'-kinase
MKPLLLLFSFLHRSGSRIKNWLYTQRIFKPKKASLPVISVGNITFGGSGKTPLVIHLIAFLIKKGYKPALITRGYRGRWEKKGGILSDGKRILGTWQDSGDEAFMVASNIPQAGVFIGKNRLLSCQEAKDSGFELGILDDGFQHRRLHRDLDMVLYDPGEKVSLREPASSLGRADIILIEKGTNLQEKEKMKKTFPQSAIFKYSVESTGFFRLKKKEKESAKGFQEKRVIAFCGIARPDRFLALLQKEAIHPVDFLTFPDHYSYSLHSLEKISTRYQKLKADALITTEKDAVKIVNTDALQDVPVYYLKIDLKLDEEFYSAMSSVLQNRV